MNKILFTGTIHVGKSTLLDHLKNVGLTDVSFIPEVARELLGISPELERDPNFQDILFEEQVRRETDAEKQGKSVIICDRGSVDIISHSRMFGHFIKPEWEEWNKTYNTIFHFNKSDVFFDTHLYPNDRNWTNFRELLEKNILSTLNDYDLHYSLLKGTVLQRANILETLISRSSHIEGQRYGKEI